MPDSHLDVVVVGGGQAGLSASYFLKQHGLRHVVLERGRIGESWRSQRWNSFTLNTPNRYNVLPGDAYHGEDPDGFSSAVAFAAYLEQYANRFQLPVREDTRVVSVEPAAPGYSVTVVTTGSRRQLACRQIVVASGGMSETRRPRFAAQIPPHIRQWHAGQYRSPDELPTGAVLVAGSAQSGMQVAEDLVEAGRTVFLSTSAVGRAPRRYRGKDIFQWLMELGFYDLRTSDVTNPREFETRQPQISGVGPRGHTVSFQSLARRGVVILGKVDRVQGSMVEFQPDASAHVAFADEVSAMIKGMIDKHVSAHRLTAPPPEYDDADTPDPDGACASNVCSLDLDREGIRSIVWATGFGADFGFLPNGVTDERSQPRHCDGIASRAGLFFLGLPWLRKRKSGIIAGITEDAAIIAGNVLASA